MGIFREISLNILEAYNFTISQLPPILQQFLNLFLIVLIILVYSVFVWKFYLPISRKDILKLNLGKYSKSEHPLLAKLFAAMFYLIEYILILPFLIFFWFIVFTLFLIFITEDIALNSILIISSTIIAAIRMIAYYKEELSKDIAKILPMTLLAIAITKPGFFDMQRIIGSFKEIPGFLESISVYLLFIIILESVLRTFDIILSSFGTSETANEN